MVESFMVRGRRALGLSPQARVFRTDDGDWTLPVDWVETVDVRWGPNGRDRLNAALTARGYPEVKN